MEIVCLDLEGVLVPEIWINFAKRTGIKERRMCADHESASTLAIAAAKSALADAKMDPMDVQVVIVGCVTGDYLFPSVSCLGQEAIGAKNAAAFDVGAACAGFIFSLNTATAMIESGQVTNALVIGSDALTKFVDFTDRSTCVLFGDGAGAVVVQAESGTDRGVIDTVLLADGSGAKHIDLQLGGSKYPVGRDYSAGKRPYIFMAGAEVYRFAVTAMGDACVKALEVAQMKAEDLDLFVPHQANLRIVQSAAKRLKLPPEKVFLNLEKYGNTSGASIPIGLCEASRTGRLKPGMVVMTVGFGAGLVWGANLIRW